MAAFKSVITFTDAKGQTARMLFYSKGDVVGDVVASADGLINAINALTNSQIRTVSGPDQFPQETWAYGDSNQFLSVSDKLIVTFLSTGGLVVRFEIPAPKSSLFLADLETLDSGNGDWNVAQSHFLDDVTCTRSGDTLALFMGGVRLRRKVSRRVSIFTKDPSLAGPAL